MIRHPANPFPGPHATAGPGWAADDVPSTVTDAPAPSANDPGVRADLVARIRREIAAGTYDTDDKLEIALGRLFMQIDNEANP